MKYSNNLFSYDPQFTDTSKNIVRLQTSTPKIFMDYYLKNGFVSATIIYCRDKSSQLINKLEPMQVIENTASAGGGGIGLEVGKKYKFRTRRGNGPSAIYSEFEGIFIEFDDKGFGRKPYFDLGKGEGIRGIELTPDDRGRGNILLPDTLVLIPDLRPPPALSGTLTCTSPNTCTSANLVVSTQSSGGGGTGKPCYTPTCNPTGSNPEELVEGNIYDFETIRVRGQSIYDPPPSYTNARLIKKITIGDRPAALFRTTEGDMRFDISSMRNLKLVHDSDSADEDYNESGDEDNTSSVSSSNNKNTKILKNIYTSMGITDTNVSGDIQDSKIQEIKDNEREFLKYTIMHNINKVLENSDKNNITYLITTLGLAGLDVPQLTSYNEADINRLVKYFREKNIDEIYDKISLELFKKLFE
jgi:hypothetical protein